MNASTPSPDILGNADIRALGQRAQLENKLRAGVARQLIASKKFSDMTAAERKVCVQFLVGETSSEAELCLRFGEVGLDFFQIDWQDTDPNDRTSMEALALVRALGGMISKTNALVMVMTVEDTF
jgi:hypothetical protein